MTPITIEYDTHSLPLPVLIMTVHSSFTLADLDEVLDRMGREFDSVGGPFYYVNVIEELNLDASAGSGLFERFEDGGILRHEDLQGIVVVNAKGFVRLVRQYVDTHARLSIPLEEAATLEGAIAVIARWLAAA